MATRSRCCRTRAVRPHDLKHTGVALLAAAGVDPMEIARRAGHSSVAFTFDRYGHLFPEADTGAAAKLDAIRTAPASVEESVLLGDTPWFVA